MKQHRYIVFIHEILFYSLFFFFFFFVHRSFVFVDLKAAATKLQPTIVKEKKKIFILRYTTDKLLKMSKLCICLYARETEREGNAKQKQKRFNTKLCLNNVKKGKNSF